MEKLTTKEQRKLYRERNKETIAAKKHADYMANPEPARRRAREFYRNKTKDRPPVLCQTCGNVVDRTVMGRKALYCSSECKSAAIKESNRKWNQNNKEHHAAYAKIYRHENLEQCRECEQRYYVKNKDAIRVRGKQYYANNPEKISARTRRWRERNPELSRSLVNARRRRVRESRNGAPPDYLEWVCGVRRAPVYQCFWCRRVFSTRKNQTKHQLTLDHIVPIELNGIDCRSNLVTSCHSCNSSKNDKNPTDWLNEIESDGINVNYLLDTLFPAS